MDIFKYPRYSANVDATPQEKIGPSNHSLDTLRREVDRQRLVIEVLVRALVEKGIYTRDQLNALANLVDMEDGVRDGRMKTRKGIDLCSGCGRTLMNRTGTCLYCGNEEVIDII